MGSLRSHSDLGQMSEKLCVSGGVYACVIRQIFRRVLGFNGDWQAFRWALLPHASSNPSLIRTAVTRAHTRSYAPARRGEAHTLWHMPQSSGPCMRLASHRVLLCADQKSAEFELLSSSIGGSDGERRRSAFIRLVGVLSAQTMSN